MAATPDNVQVERLIEMSQPYNYRDRDGREERGKSSNDQSARWSPARLPELWFQKPKPGLQFSLWDLCCVMSLTGLGIGLARWYRDGFSGVFAIIIWTIVAGCLVFTLRGREIRIMVVTAVLFALVALAGMWLAGLGAAIDFENDVHQWDNGSWTYQGQSPDEVAKEIARLKALRDSGGITQQTYEDAIDAEGLARFPH